MGAPGDRIVVDTAEKGELQFLVPELNLEILEFRGVEEVWRQHLLRMVSSLTNLVSSITFFSQNRGVGIRESYARDS